MEYFMDDMQDWEVQDIYSNLQYADASSWEQTRWLMYVVAQVNSRKQLKVTDILKLPWDGGSIETTISHENITRLKEKARLLEKELLNKK